MADKGEVGHAALRVDMGANGLHRSASGIYDPESSMVYRQRGGSWCLYAREGKFWYFADKASSVEKGVFKLISSHKCDGRRPGFFRTGLQLPQACDRSRSECENHGFSAITSSKSIFRDIFVIFVGSPSRIFRKITILNTILAISTT